MKGLVKFFLLLMCFNVLQQGSSQNIFPPAFQLITDTISTVTLPALNWQYLEDRTAIWTIDSVLQPSFVNKFQNFTPPKRSSDTLLYNYWVRFRLKNTLNREAHIGLRFL